MIIFTDTKELHKRFLKNPEWDITEFTFILISDMVKTDNTYRTRTVTAFVPHANTIQAAAEGDEIIARNNYISQITTPQIDASLATLVGDAVTRGTKYIFITSHMENTQPVKTFDILRDYIEALYHISTYTLKDYQKKGEKIFQLSPQQKEYTLDIVKRRIEMCSMKTSNLIEAIDDIINEDKKMRQYEKERKEKKRKKKEKKRKKKEKKDKFRNPFI